MPNYDVRYAYTDPAGVSYTAKTVVNATDGDNAVSLASTNLATRLPTTRWTIVGVAPSTAFSDTQDDVGANGAYSPSVLAIGGRDVVRAVAATNAVDFIEAVPSAAGSPGRVGFRAAGTDTNIGVYFQPKGTGGIAAQAPDNTATGGNARGTNAVDWQTNRASANSVASGSNATIGGGNSNIANGTNSVVAGGQQNAATSANASVGGGNNNTASANSATVAGGNVNTASAAQATVAGGSNNTANASFSWCPGGQWASTRAILGRGAWAAARIAAAGDAQCGEHPLLRQTTDATPTRLTADNAAASTTNTINLPDFSSYAGVLTVTAKATGATAAATWRLNVSAVRGNGVGTVVVYEGAASAITPTASNGTGSAWRLDIAADTTNGGIAVTGTGAAATTINWSARFANVEVTTAS